MAEIRSRFDAVRRVVVDFTGDPGRTKQSFADESDINVIMRRFERTGVLVDPTVVARRQAAFGDFSEGLDFMECQNRLAAAQAAFAGLPSSVRERFGNEPWTLVEFLADEANRAEAVRLGLLAERPSPPIGEQPVGGKVEEPPK